MGYIPLSAFERMLDERAPEAPWRDRAIEMFKKYGEVYSSDMLNVFLHATDQEKVGEVLEVLEAHFEEQLSYQHPDARGHLVDSMGQDRTINMFVEDLYEGVLGLQPSS